MVTLRPAAATLAGIDRAKTTCRANAMVARPALRWLSRQDIEILPDTLRQPDEQRMTDERVTNRHFGQMREPPEHHQVLEIEIVPGVHREAHRVRRLSCRLELRE